MGKKQFVVTIAFDNDSDKIFVRTIGEVKKLISGIQKNGYVLDIVPKRSRWIPPHKIDFVEYKELPYPLGHQLD